MAKKHIPKEDDYVKGRKAERRTLVKLLAWREALANADGQRDIGHALFQIRVLIERLKAP